MKPSWRGGAYELKQILKTYQLIFTLSQISYKKKLCHFWLDLNSEHWIFDDVKELLIPYIKDHIAVIYVF